MTYRVRNDEWRLPPVWQAGPVSIYPLVQPGCEPAHAGGPSRY
jgi:hypothetical protein